MDIIQQVLSTVTELITHVKEIIAFIISQFLPVTQEDENSSLFPGSTYIF